MSDERSVDERAREMIDRNLYMVLGTADRDGRPWASPVYYAPSGYREFLWISDPEARHSRNIAARPEVGIVIFDSSVPINTGQGVYMDALATELAPGESAEAIEIFSRRGVGHGAGPTRLEDVRAPAKHRLYRARASAHWVLDERDNRLRADP
jgi:uncharacterized protein YhbP (UPF0306 family)